MNVLSNKLLSHEILSSTEHVHFRHDNGIKHFNLAKQNDEYFVQDVRFSTVSDLITYYGHNDVPNQECVKHVKLTYPILNRQSVPLPSVLSTKSLPRSISSSRSISTSGSPSLLRDTFTLPRTRDTSGTNSNGPTVSHERHKSVPELPLPHPPKPQRGSSLDQHSPKQKSIFRFFRGKKKSHEDDSAEEKDSETDGQPGASRLRTVSDSSISDRMSLRPPVPLPPEAARKSPEQQKDGEAYQYESVRDTEVNRVKELIQTLKSTDSYAQNMEKCECGLSFEESELPRGWSMHISHDRLTNGRLFFMGPNKDTAWNLPLDVSLELSPDQQERIRDLLERSDHPIAQSGAESGESQMGSLPSAAVNYSIMSLPDASAVITQQQQQQNMLTSIDECGGGASSIASSLPQAGRHATQHNEHTGSTESPCLRLGP